MTLRKENKMNKYKLISTAAAAIIIISGLIYLSVGEAFLLPVLILAAVAVCIMGGALGAEVKASGKGNFVSYIPAICFFVLAAFICAATVFYLMQ